MPKTLGLALFNMQCRLGLLSFRSCLKFSGKRRLFIATANQRKEETFYRNCKDAHFSNEIKPRFQRCNIPGEGNNRKQTQPCEVVFDLGSQYMPISCGKTHRPSISASAYRNYATLNKSSSSSVDEPFDICLPGALEEDSVEPCIYDERNWKKQSQVLRPGMILLKNYISLDEQVDIVKRCRKLSLGPGGFYVPRNKCGGNMNLHMMCLGLHWDSESNKYRTRRQHDDTEPPGVPHEFSSLVGCAIDDSQKLIKRCSTIFNGENILPRMSPNVCVINFYSSTGRLGMHQDSAESHESLRRQLPVVSVSVGDSSEFLYGTQRNVRKASRVLLESGDVLIFVGRSRDIFHGVASIIPNTAPPLLVERAKLQPGRLNLTFREY